MPLLWNVRNQNFLITSFDQDSPNKLFILDIKLLSFDFSVDVGSFYYDIFPYEKLPCSTKMKIMSETHDLQKDKIVRKTSKIENA